MDALHAQIVDRLLGIVAQILRVALVDVGRLAVGDQQHQPLLCRLLVQMPAGMTQGRAHAGRETALHAREP